MLHMLIGCLALAALSHGQQDQNPPGFISIDCGAPNNYYDDFVKFYYNNDAGFVDSGMNVQVSRGGNDRRSESMRVFSNGKRNCYTLKPNQGKGYQYLVRAAFWYGDYDDKHQQASFDLHIDVNYWDRVSFSSYVYSEIIYTPPRDYIQVCLVNIGLGDPFISSLELRLLSDSIYHIDSGALVNRERRNLGSNNTYRHPQDDYDRIWNGITYSEWLSVSNRTDIVTSTNNDNYKVPPEVLMTAQQVQNVSDSLGLHWTPESSSDTWYIYFHFLELQQPNGQLRELATYVEDKYVKSIILNNLKPVTVVSPAFNGSNPSFTVKATAQSILPPLLNAFEKFNVVNLSYSPTIFDDFNAMYDIKKTYEVARDTWQGDPCVPSQFMWSGVNCSNDGLPRIISLNLSSTGLKGMIVASFNLTALVSLDLSNNELIGSVPDFFAQMPNLTFLDLSQNNFEGLVPQALLNKKANASLQLSLEGNQNLCQSNPCPTKKTSTKVAAIIASFSAIALVIAFLTVLLLFWRTKRRHNHEVAKTVTSGGSNQSLGGRKNRPFTSAEITRITNNFKTVIGEGAFGKVYLGHLDDGDQGTQVAVKLLSRSSKQGYKEFHTEVKHLMVFHHRNLVSLIGYCDEPEYMALIYEFMSNGNVREHLSEYNPNVLSWMQRLQIAIDVAYGLEYLHNGCKPPIIHRDLKTANILLNENMQAKIADFGLSKAFVTDLDSHIITYPAGTPGYLDPEFHTSGTLTKKSDVYSFGVILFELLTGHPAIVKGQTGNVHILHWVTPLIERGDIKRIIDPRLKHQFYIGSAWKAVEIAMSCVPTVAVQRPYMDWVLSELKECLAEEINLGSNQRIGSRKGQNNSIEMMSSEIEMVPNAR